MGNCLGQRWLKKYEKEAERKVKKTFHHSKKWMM